MDDIRASLARWANAAKRDAIAVYLAARDPRVPFGIKAFAAAVAAYALSPIDLIPDFIPVLGYLDDMILLPAAVWVIIRLIDPAIMSDLRAQAASIAERPVSTAGAATIAAIWIAAAGLLVWAFWPGRGS
jgi:uncharacterized membrane protein YkvA (DUF1232 family)